MMTPRQIELARHALGLKPGCLVSYRNAFHADPGHRDYGEWQAMVAQGYATKRHQFGLLAGPTMFHLTRAGAEAALLPGDVLNSEDWP